jgi:enterobactin synthetase component D
MKALEAIDRGLAGYEIGRSESGAPVWPGGVTGSITHTDDFAAAAVASCADTASLGIDTERIMSSAQAGQVAGLVASEREVAEACKAGLSRLEAITLVFSAKESIFKCLHPITGRYFDFRDVRVDAVDPHLRIFTARLVQTLSPSFRAESTLQGGFEIEAPWVHTGIALRSTSVTDRRTSGSLEHRARL